MGAAIMAPFQMQNQMDATGAAYKATVVQNNYNKKLALEAAQDATDRGVREAQITGMKYDKLKGEQIAGTAANGIEVTSGSALDTLANTDLMSSIDQTTIRNNAAREAYGYKAQAYGFDVNSVNASRKAKYDNQATMLNGIGSMLNVPSSLIGL